MFKLSLMETRVLKIKFKNFDYFISTKYRDSGDKLIFFIHGLGCSKESFDDVWGIDCLKDYSILTFDLPGFGNSSRPENFSYNMVDHAEICSLLLGKVPDKKIIIAAHSMGGAIGLLLAEKIGNRLIAFINIEGNLFTTDCSVSRKAAASISFNIFKKQLFSNIKLLPSLTQNKGTRLWAQWIEKSDPRGFNKSAASLVEWTDSGKLLQKFRELKTKKIYVCGEINSHRKILSMLGDIEKVIISGCGHFPMNDNPEEFYNTVFKIIS